MKLGEALNERSRLAKQISEWRDLAIASAITQEGEEPPVNVPSTIDKAMLTIERLSILVGQINRTNSITHLDHKGDTFTLTAALAMRDGLRARISFLEAVLQKVANVDEFSHLRRRQASELREVRQVEVDGLVTVRDSYAQGLRDLEVAIQSTNWTTELL